VLGHLHWDHTQGLPFFSAGDHPGSRVTLYAPAQGGPGEDDDIQGLMARAMSPPHFPISPAQLRGSWRFASLPPGTHQLEGFEVLALEIPHKGGRAFGYRISAGRAAITYISDHCPISVGAGPVGLGEYHEAALRLACESDILFHDAQYTDEELPARAHFGHSSAGYALGLAEAANARRVVLYHHDPQRTDEQVDAMVSRYRCARIPVEAACEGAVIDLP
jgi:ribonuclease BN (tRNA processing enzyme)